MRLWINRHWRKGVTFFLAVLLIYSLNGIAQSALDSRQNRQTYQELQQLYYEEERQPGSMAQHERQGDGSQQARYVVRELRVQPKFQSLLQENKDVVGWLRIEGASIDYPVVQARDNDYYLNRDVLGNRNKAGSLFMDYRVQVKDDDRHIIIYGHNMKNKTMFGNLSMYRDREFFEVNDLIQFDDLYTNQTWKIFSAYQTSTDFDYIRTSFADDQDFLAFAQELQNNSLHQTGITIKASDRILTLSTCTNTDPNGRFTVHAVLVQDAREDAIQIEQTLQESHLLTEQAAREAAEAQRQTEAEAQRQAEAEAQGQAEAEAQGQAEAEAQGATESEAVEVEAANVEEQAQTVSANGKS